jgi:hypothetical protein
MDSSDYPPVLDKGGNDIYPALDAELERLGLLDEPIGEAMGKLCKAHGWAEPPADWSVHHTFIELNRALDQETTPFYG